MMQATGPQEITAVIGVIGGVCAVINCYLTLRLRLAILEGERRILKQVRCEYRLVETCNALMHEHAAGADARI